MVDEFKSRGFEVDREVVEESIIKIPKDSNFTEDFVKILDRFNNDENIFKLGHSERIKLFDDSLLATAGDAPTFKGRYKRYPFIKSFRKHYHIGRTALKGKKLEMFRDIGCSFINYKGMLAFEQLRTEAIMENKGLGNKLKGMF